MNQTIVIELSNKVARRLEREARSLGITVEEEIRGALGRYYRILVDNDREDRLHRTGQCSNFPIPTIRVTGFGGPGGIFSDIMKQNLIMQAQEGALSCSNCTLKLTVEDVNKNECSACHTPIITHGGPPSDPNKGKT